MTDESFRGFRCWRSAEVQRTVLGDIGALGTNDDALFLAAHAPVPLDLGPGTEKLRGGEREILESLTREIGVPGQNTLIAVTGDVGTGKSHAVRWVRAHLPEDPLRYQTIYVPRDLSTLRSLLGHILDELPGEKAVQAKRQLESAIGTKPEAQLRDDLIFNLRQVLTFELPDHGQGAIDEDAREMRTFLLGQRDDRSEPRRGGLSEILLAPQVMDHLGRDGGTIAAIIQSLRSERGGRDVSYPQFTPNDIPRGAGVRGQLGKNVQSLYNSVQSEPRYAVALLNEALQRAVSMTIGFGVGGGVTLNDVFNETRRLLRQQGGEGIDLVLLFEDLAQFGLVDADLYDQFTQQPEDQYCPLRVVFATTDGKFRELPNTVQSRTGPRFRVQNLELGEGDADCAMVTFTARYLNNGRLGRERLIDARRDATDRDREDGSWVPNKCTDCLHKDECFAAFGKAHIGVAGMVGLYPHNETSLRRAFLHLREQNRLSPRSIINEVVRTFLSTADPEIEARAFPSKEIANLFQTSVTRPQEAIVKEGEAPSPEERERLLRARIIWRNGQRENPGMHVAFDLPGADIPPEKEEGTAEESTPVAGKPPTASREQELLDERTKRMHSLYEWDGKVRELPDGEMTEFRNLFRDWTLVKVDRGKHLVNAGQGKAEAVMINMFPATSFFIDNAPGNRLAPGRLCFEILPSPHAGWRLLTAARWFNDHGHWDPDAPDRKWEFPADVEPAVLQIELENYLNTCATAVEERFLREITSSAGVRPAAAVVSLRTVALRVMGGLNRDDLTRVVDVAGGKPEKLPNAWLTSWEPLAKSAQGVLESLDAVLIGEFAAAHQGNSTDPIVVDAATLESAAKAAFEDPAGAVECLGQFSEIRFSELVQAQAKLTVDWPQVMADERDELLDALQFLRESTVTGGRTLANWAEELGKRANGDRIFRPTEGYSRFTEAIAFIKAIPASELDRWLEAAAAVSDALNHTALLDAQSWSFWLRSYNTSLRTVLEAMRATGQHLPGEIARQAGGNPQELAERLADRFDTAASLLDRLGQGGSHDRVRR